MTPPLVSRRAAAALFLERQRLDRPRARRLTSASLQSFVEDTCGLQIDSVNVIDRAHHLTLWSRFGEYDRPALDRLVYRRRVLFEYLSHVACFVATSDLPMWRGWMAETPERWRRRYGSALDAKLVGAVEEAIGERGPLGNADFERPSGNAAAGWWNWKPAMHALDYLWKCGRIAIHSREHFHKRFALMERVLPKAALIEPLTGPELRRQRLLRSLRAMGAAAADDLRSYWTWPGLPMAEQRATLAALVREGLVTELRLEGQRAPWFARTEDLPALERAARARRPSRGTTLLCPFDSFLWHRERTLRLFGFHYRIEIYVPGHKRTHGYYTLPVLHEGHFIGRVDPKVHRERRELEVRHLQLEPWFAAGEPPPGAAWGTLDRDEALHGVATSLHSLKRFVGADRVTLRRVTPARLKAAMASALRKADA